MLFESDKCKDLETLECKEEITGGSEVEIVASFLKSETNVCDESDSNKETKDHLQVVVKDKFGKKNVLTVTEKENCPGHQKQRLKLDKGINPSEMPNTSLILKSNNHCAINTDSSILSNCKWSKQTEPDCSGVDDAAESGTVIAAEADDTNTGTHSKEAYQERCGNASGIQHLCQNAAANCDTFHSTPKYSTNSPASREQLGVTPVVKISHESDLNTNDYAEDKLKVTVDRSGGGVDSPTGAVVADSGMNKKAGVTKSSACSSGRMEESHEAVMSCHESS